MMNVMAEPLEAYARQSVDLGDFGSWMASEQKRIFLLCKRLLQDTDEADSATQDVFLKAFKALKNLNVQELDHPERWVTRIAVNTCLDRLRSNAWKIWRKRPAPEDESLILSMTARREPDAEAQAFAKEIQQRLEKALVKLSERQRAVFTLRHYDAYSLDEIAEILKLDTGTVKAHLFRALGKLREELRDVYGSRQTAGAPRNIEGV
ncbi:MAG: RNA polymerase sigma factor [Bryobacteraceae bacterium]